PARGDDRARGRTERKSPEHRSARTIRRQCGLADETRVPWPKALRKVAGSTARAASFPVATQASKSVARATARQSMLPNRGPFPFGNILRPFASTPQQLNLSTFFRMPNRPRLPFRARYQSEPASQTHYERSIETSALGFVTGNNSLLQG